MPTTNKRTKKGTPSSKGRGMSKELIEEVKGLRQWLDYFEAKALEYYLAGENANERSGRAKEIEAHIEASAEEVFDARTSAWRCDPPYCMENGECVPCGILLLLKLLPGLDLRPQK